MNKSHFRRRNFILNQDTLSGYPTNDQVILKQAKVNYHDLFFVNNDRHFNINSFESIGWPDPFPNMFSDGLTEVTKSPRRTSLLRKNLSRESSEVPSPSKKSQKDGLNFDLISAKSIGEPRSPIRKGTLSSKKKRFDPKSLFDELNCYV